MEMICHGGHKEVASWKSERGWAGQSGLFQTAEVLQAWTLSKDDIISESYNP